MVSKMPPKTEESPKRHDYVMLWAALYLKDTETWSFHKYLFISVGWLHWACEGICFPRDWLGAEEEIEIILVPTVLVTM